MNAKEYIATGLLELYAMSALPEEESAEVEKMCAAHPEVASELAQIQETLNRYAKSHARNPDPSVRTGLMDRLNVKNEIPAPRNPFRNPYEITYKYLIAACIASLIVSTFASVFFYQKWSEAEDQYLATVNEKNVANQNLSSLKYDYDKMNHDMSVIHDPAMATFTLKAADSSRYYKAHIFWNRYTHETFIDIADLSPAPDGMQYQLWAVTGESHENAGMFSVVAGEVMHKMQPVQSPDSWMVTMEPEGGSETPSMDQLVLVSP